MCYFIDTLSHTGDGMRTFAYCRVSTAGQETANQVAEIAAAGHKIEPARVIEEIISGAAPAFERPGFSRLVDRLEAGDTVITTKLDRLGRNALDVRQTIEKLEKRKIKVRCLQLGDVDLTSAAGKMVMSVIGAVAEMERDLLVERTRAGLARAKAAGKVAGRPARLTSDQKRAIGERLAAGEPIAKLAREFQVDRQVIRRAAN